MDATTGNERWPTVAVDDTYYVECIVYKRTVSFYTESAVICYLRYLDNSLPAQRDGRLS